MVAGGSQALGRTQGLIDHSPADTLVLAPRGSRQTSDLQNCRRIDSYCLKCHVSTHCFRAEQETNTRKKPSVGQTGIHQGPEPWLSHRLCSHVPGHMASGSPALQKGGWLRSHKLFFFFHLFGKIDVFLSDIFCESPQVGTRQNFSKVCFV